VDLITRFPISRDSYDPRIPKNRGIKRNSLFGLVIKPQTWGDLLNDFHGVSPGRAYSGREITVTTS